MTEQKIIINVGRQLGSGGRVIAKRLSEIFGCMFYDKELLNLAAKESGFSEKFFEQHDVHWRFFKSLFHMHAQHVSDNNFYPNRFSQESLFQFQSEAIKKAANSGSCVFVGRCADYILRDYPNTFNIFITAKMSYRIRQVANRHGCDDETARKIITHEEESRASYYNYYTGKKWGHSQSYDLCVDSTILGLEGTAEMIAQFIRDGLKAQKTEDGE